MSAHTSGELIGGRYALGELLGVGGTGSVFAAVDVSAGDGSDSAVAVKLLHPHLCADEASREAFLREAELAIGLQHPNVVRVRGAGLHDAAGVTMPWIALDMLDGPTLREWVDAAGRLSTADAAALAEGLLAGLVAAHATGIVHRDISPQNIILHGMGERPAGASLSADMVRIVDFGLADVTGRSTLGSDVLLAGGAGSAGSSGSTGDPGSAAAGVVGNAAYMSPEQAQGLPMRATSDIYQAGAVLYFALTGRAPYPRDTTEQVMQAHVSAPPPVPSALAPGAREFDRVVTRAMAKKPVHRYWNAEQFRAAAHSAVTRFGGAPDAPEGVDDRGDIDPAGAVGSGDGLGDGPGAGLGVGLGVGVGGGLGVGAVAVADGLAEPATRVLRASQRRESADAPVPMAYLGDATAEGSGGGIADSRTRAGGGAAAVVGGILILGLAGWAVIAASAAPTELVADPSTSPSPTVSQVTPSATPTSTPGPASPPPLPSSVPSEEPRVTIPVDVAVPVLHGSLSDADAILRAAGLVLGAVTRVESAEAAERLLSQLPSAGERLSPGGAVNVTVASGSNVVPQVGGMTVASATAMLQSAGFVVAGDRGSAAPSATVTTSQPAAGTVLRVGVTVTLVVAASTPTPLPTTTQPAETGGEP